MQEKSTHQALWPIYNACTMLGSLAVFYLTGSALLFALIALASFTVFVVLNRSAWLPFGWWGGWANTVTGLRMLMVAGVAGGSTYLHPYVIFGVGVLILVADGLDGYLARKYHTVSAFGDCFDKETDAFFVLAYGVVIVQQELAGDWVLIPGLLRYMYVIFLSAVKVQPQVPHASFRRQFMGMWLMGTLLSPFVISSLVYIPGLVFAIGLVVYSFCVDAGKMLLQAKEKVSL